LSFTKPLNVQLPAFFTLFLKSLGRFVYSLFSFKDVLIELVQIEA